MQLDFQHAGIRYMLNFECADCENGIFELRVYYSLELDSLYASSLKLIKNNKIVWGHWDDTYLPKSAQDYCDRLVKLLVFS